MLATLRIKNIALAENVKIDFTDGLNVITGETGAGKSMLIGALNLLLGDRADRKIIRTGADACGAEAIFLIKKTSVLDPILDEFGISPCEDKQLIVRRIIKANGSSQNWINDSPVTLQALKRVGETLVDMHGAHEHQSLLHPSFQLDVLDAFGDLGDVREDYRKLYDRLGELQVKHAELQGSGQNVQEQMDMLVYRVKELEDAELKEGEEEKIEQEHKVVGNAQRILELGSQLSGALVEGEASVIDALAHVQKVIEELTHLAPQAEEWKKEARSIAVQVQELGSSISGLIQNMDADPQRLTWLDERITIYRKLRRKYNATVSELLQLLEQSKDRLRDLQTRGERLAELDKEMVYVRAELQKKGESLRKRRAGKIEQLTKAVKTELRELGFTHGSFDIFLTPTEPTASGLDQVEFGFAPNLGETMRPLRDIASSGELSRVMLALKKVLAEHDHVPVLIFDEIDANIGGETGSVVGRKLAEIAEKHQVLCITHLPQVAIFGKNHFAVSKHVEEGRTLTQVKLLNKSERVEEVARMLGGRDLTKVTLQHARQMLEKV